MSGFATNLQTLLPEIVVVCGAMALLLFGALRGERGIRLVSWLAIAVLAAAGWLVISPASTAPSAFGGAFVADDFSRFAKILILAGSAVTLLMAQDFLRAEGLAKFEFPVLVLIATGGMMLMVSASSFIALYMGLELQSLSLYVLAAFHRDNLRSTEAGLKYFVLGALSSGMMLYGISLIYGFTGTTDFAAVAHAVMAGSGIGLIFGIVFLISGLAFKISAVPFHMWTPDVYEGAPTPITAFFSMSPKVAAMFLFLRTMVGALGPALHEWQQVIVAVAVLSMALGAIAAIGQTNIKRLMAYSSIGHMGYALLGLAAATPAGIQGVLIYMTIYVITNAGVFACILAMRRDGEAVETIADLAGLARTQPRLAFAFMIFMVSLSGIPPFAGFFAKFYVFLAAIQAGLHVPAVLGVVASVVGAYYYWRVFKIMYFDEPAQPFDRDHGTPLNAIMAASGAFTLLFIVGAAPLVAVASEVSRTLLP
ncbi:MAG TPA: NADH-quinone oxidoreductase subunit NuoN [Rhizomicrobium sp.]|nr:NADH-quinone oxidoreductase subunit NuoN [Rhizomicrobium sp.]